MVGAANGQTGVDVGWGVSFAADYVDGSGMTITPSATDTITFELGIFGVDPATGMSFVPSFANAAQWDSFWMPFPNEVGMVSGTAGDFTSDTVTFGNQTGEIDVPNVFAATQVYLWGFRNGEDTFDPTSGVTPDWFLSTETDGTNVAASDNWISFDGSDNTSHDTNAINWIAADSTPIIGGVDDGGGNLNRIIFQTIPEPSSALLSLMGVLFFARRRRRS